MSDSKCVQRDTLKRYLVGCTDDQLTAVIESHLSDCETCERTILELESDPDTLVELVRGAGHQAANNSQGQSLTSRSDQFDAEQVTGRGRTQAPTPDSNREQPSVIVRAISAAQEMQFAPTQQRAPEIRAGERIDAYNLIRAIGRGGMGTVYLARHGQLDKQVAIKVLPTSIGDKPELVARFQREIRAAGRLNHPAIVSATDAGLDNGTHYLVMEYIDGLDLSRIARLIGPLRIADACELIRQVAIGLSHAHAAGVVHRDIKPSNLMLDQSGRAKILDFGLAQVNLWDEAAAELTTVGQLMGTLDYMAPEQAERSEAVDYRADLYALGATLFRLLSGRAPLAAAPNMSLLEKVRMLAEQSAPRLSTLREDAPEELVNLVAQMLSRQPSARPASAAHIAEAILPFCAEANLTELLALARRNAELAEPSNTTPTADSRLASPIATPRANHRSTRRWIAWTAAALLPFMIAAGILITLETQKGVLVIQSEAEATVKIVKDGQPVRNLTIHPGTTSTRLLADKYEITLATPSDSVSLDRDQFTLKSGETVVATVKQTNSDSAPSSPSNVPPTIPSTAEVYDGKPLSEWLTIFQQERNQKTRLEAVMAIDELIDEKTRDHITPIVLRVLRESIFKSESNDSYSDWQSIAFRTLRAAKQGDAFYELLATEIATQNAAWTHFLLSCESLARYDTKPQRLIEMLVGLLEDKDAIPERTVKRVVSILFRISNTFDVHETTEAISMALENTSMSMPQVFLEIQDIEWPYRLQPFRHRLARRLIADDKTSVQSVIKAIHLLRDVATTSEDIELFGRRIGLVLLDRNRLIEIAVVPSTRERLWRGGFPVGRSNFIGVIERGEHANEMLHLLRATAIRNMGAGILPSIKEVVNALTNQPNSLKLAEYFSVPTTGTEAGVDLQWPEMELKINSDAKPRAFPTGWEEISHEQRVTGLILAYARRVAEQIELRTQVDSKPIVDQGKTAPTASAAQSRGSSTGSRSAPPISTVLSYDKVTLGEWLAILQNDRSYKTQKSALEAISALASPETANAIAPAVLDSLDRYSEMDLKNPSLGSKPLGFECMQVLKKLYPGKLYFDLIVRELDSRGAKFGELVLSVEGGPATPADIETLFAKASQIVKHQPSANSVSPRLAANFLVNVASEDFQKNRVLELLKSSKHLGLDFWCERREENWPQFVRQLRASSIRNGFDNLTLDARDSVLAIMAIQELAVTPTLHDTIARRMDLLLADRERMTGIVQLDSHAFSVGPNHIPEGYVGEWPNFDKTHAIYRANEMIELLDLVTVSRLSDKLHEAISKIAMVLDQETHKRELVEIFRDLGAGGGATPTFSWPELEASFVDRTFQQSWNQLSLPDRVANIVAAYATSLAGRPKQAPANAQSAPSKSQPALATVGSELARVEIAKPPIHGGHTLNEWFEILERDRDDETRKAALRAIGNLRTPENRAEVTKKLLAIARSESPKNWMVRTKSLTSIDFPQSTVTFVMGAPNPPGELDGELWSVLNSRNKIDAEFIKAELLSENANWSKRWLAVMVNDFKFQTDDSRIGAVHDWLLQPENVVNFDQSAAALMREFLLRSLYARRDVNEINVRQVFNTIRASKLGVRGVLTSSPVWLTENNLRYCTPTELQSTNAPALMVVEQAVLKIAVEVLLSDQATPDEVTCAACNIASGPDIDPTLRDQVVSKLGQLLVALANNAQRRQTVQRGTHFPSNQNNSTPHFLFSHGIPSLPSKNVFIQSSDHANFQLLRSRHPNRFVNSEALATIALVTRLNCTKDLLIELRKLLSATEEAYYFVEVAGRRLAANRSLGSYSFSWPFGIVSGGDASLKSIPQASWTDAVIYIVSRQCFDAVSEHQPEWTKSKELLDRRLRLGTYDQNLDGKLSTAETANIWGLPPDANKDGFIDLSEFANSAVRENLFPDNQSLRQMDLEWARRLMQKYDTNYDGKLTPDEWTPMIVKPVGADTNGDGAISVEEYARFRAKPR